MNKEAVKKRCFRIDPCNPYRTRELTYRLQRGERHWLVVEQRDYVLQNQVAEKISPPLEVEKPHAARQLVEYMLDHAATETEAIEIYEDWLQGRLTLIHNRKDVLVTKALQKRFARNLRRM